MSKNNTLPEILCPVQDHPELAYLDESGVQTWAEAHNLTLYRNWQGLLSTDLADAYRLRVLLDADRTRQAEAEAARHAELEAEDELRFGRLRRQMEADARREALRAEIDVLAPEQVDARYLEWERRATENGDARFANLSADANRPEPETRDAITRLKDKEAGR